MFKQDADEKIHGRPWSDLKGQYGARVPTESHLRPIS